MCSVGRRHVALQLERRQSDAGVSPRGGSRALRGRWQGLTKLAVAEVHDARPIRRQIVELSLRGAAALKHNAAPTFLDHLVGTWRVLKAWQQPDFVCLAGLFHSCYATREFPRPLFEVSQRKTVQKLIGPEAEELAFFFCLVDRNQFSELLVKSRRIPKGGLRVDDHREKRQISLSRSQVAQLAVVELANLAEQVKGPDGGPGPWMAWCSKVLPIIASDLEIVPAVFDDGDFRLTAQAERASLEQYRRGVTTRSADDLHKASESNPWAAEPYIELSAMLEQAGYQSDAFNFADEGVRRLTEWGTAWDKRRSYSRWLAMALGLRGLTAPAKNASHRKADLQAAGRICVGW